MFTAILMALSFLAGLIMMYKWGPQRHAQTYETSEVDNDPTNDYYPLMNVIMSATKFGYHMRDIGGNVKWLSFINEQELEEIYAVGYTEETRFGRIHEFDHFTWQPIGGEKPVKQEPVVKIGKITPSARQAQQAYLPEPPEWAQ